MLKTYKYRLLPTKEQQKVFSLGISACRFVYNLALETKIRAWESNRIRVSAYDLHKQLFDLKKSGLADWLNNVNGSALQQSILNMDKAFISFFRGGGFPKFKKKRFGGSMRIMGVSEVNNGKIRFPKYGWVDIVYHRTLPKNGKIKSVTLKQTSSGDFYVAILIKTDEALPMKKLVIAENAVGIDFGIKTFSVLSDGIQIEALRPLLVNAKRLRVEQRRMSRRFKKGVKITDQTKRWHKQRLVVAKLHERIANQRSNFLHQWSDAITKRYDTICIENLNVSGMVKNQKLAKSIIDASWSEFARQLEYKCEWRGKNLVKIGRFEPSSKTCSFCGLINDNLKLQDREWSCECGAHHDRDLNAAINIKKMGLTQVLQSLT